MMFHKVGIVGLGLIGGSIAKALKARCGISTIVACNRRDDVLKAAYAEGVIDGYTTEINELFSNCDIIFICTPVDKIFEYAQKLLPYIDSNCILTDVGSTKSAIYERISSLGKAVTYIGGHPMTGSERFRYSASKEHLFENAYYILTPGEYATPTQTENFAQLLRDIGAIPIIMPPKQHDFVVASISHVPHIVASALVNTVKELDTPEQYMHQLAAGGFKDITRIASSSPEMWESICIENQSEILTVLQALEDNIKKMKEHIASLNKEELFSYFDTARQYRDSFVNVTPSSYVKRYEITVDVLDRPGSIAIITVLFSSHNINIKNMSIINNREHETGVLYFAFDNENDRQTSIQLLRQMNYEVFVKD